MNQSFLKTTSFFLVVIAMLIAGCTQVPITQTDPTKPKPTPTPIVKPTPAPTAPSLSWEKDHPERKAWSKTVNENVILRLEKLEMAKGIEEFCPRYHSKTKTEKIHFWSELIVRMTYFESSWKPATVFGEPPPLSVDSIGLFQLSYESETGKVGCEGISREKNSLKDPFINLKCGIALMGYYIAKDQKFTEGHVSSNAKGLARYWAVLRNLKLTEVKNPDGTKIKKWLPRPSYSAIKKHTTSLSVCK